MLLAVDIGNTQTVIGLYEGTELRYMWRLATDATDTSDELRVKLRGLLTADNVDEKAIKGLALASVVPRLTTSWEDVSRYLFERDAFTVNARVAGSLFKVNYGNPDEIGADRVADTVAAISLYGAPVMVVDFGTATNIEIVDKDGVFVGGIIAPGLETSANALFNKAARLGAIELVDPQVSIGRNTNEAVQVGIIYGEADRVDGLVQRVFNQLGYHMPVVATGGLASTVAAASKTITVVNTELTLEGLRLMYANKSKQQ